MVPCSSLAQRTRAKGNEANVVAAGSYRHIAALLANRDGPLNVLLCTLEQQVIIHMLHSLDCRLEGLTIRSCTGDLILGDIELQKLRQVDARARLLVTLAA